MKVSKVTQASWVFEFFGANLLNLGPKFCSFERIIRQFADAQMIRFFKVLFLSDPKPNFQIFQLYHIFKSSGTS